MDWTRAIDAYCERTDAGFWSEPVNAVTNAAFVLVALLMWARSAGRTSGRILSVVLGLIGLGSFLFHTFATGWAALLDTTPILAFVLIYIFLANRDYWAWPSWMAVLGALAFVPYAILLTPAFNALPFFHISSFYWPLPLLIGTYAFLLRHIETKTARGLAIGAGLLCLSLTARSLDMEFCAAIPLGTHFLWHILNAIMLGWMIEVWLIHRRAKEALTDP
jgi:hypothetical protein